ncbi:hypothetical protein [Streptomyces sp. NPDC088910]
MILLFLEVLLILEVLSVLVALSVLSTVVIGGRKGVLPQRPVWM